MNDAQPEYGKIWRDVEGDYSSEEDEEDDAKMLNKVRVVVRVRPLI